MTTQPAPTDPQPEEQQITPYPPAPPTISGSDLTVSVYQVGAS